MVENEATKLRIEGHYLLCQEVCAFCCDVRMAMETFPHSHDVTRSSSLLFLLVFEFGCFHLRILSVVHVCVLSEMWRVD